MSIFHCSCGFAIDGADEFGDHLHQAFARDDNIGTDGRPHVELADVRPQQHACACGFVASDTPELDDHLLLTFITADGIGNDGKNHVPTNPSTPDRWYVRKGFDE